MTSKLAEETLLSPSNILLYGRVLTDLTFNYQSPGTDHPPVTGEYAKNAPPRLGSNNFLQSQLNPGAGQGDVKLARIYAFAYEGHYYDMPKPAIFIVHGDGTQADADRPGSGDGTQADADRPGSRVARSQPSTSHTGAAKMSSTSADDLLVWSYDKNDISLRLDTESGKLEDILLGATLGPDGGAQVSGARVSGARVSGARVSGARVGGSGGGD